MDTIQPTGPNRMHGMRLRATGVVLAGASMLAACGGEGASDDGFDALTMGAAIAVDQQSDDTVDSTTTSSTTEATTTTSTPESERSEEDAVEAETTEEQQAAIDELVADGFSEEQAIDFVKAISIAPLFDTDQCVTRVADAKGGEDNAFSGNWLVKTDGGNTVINVSQFATAGEGIVSNGGPNLFTDSVASDFQEGSQDDASEVAAYFADSENVEARTEEARAESYARLCGDPYELASAMVVTANAKLGNTSTRVGDLSEFLKPYLVSAERTDVEMTAAIQKAVDAYVVEYPEGVDSASEITEYLDELSDDEREAYLSAYETQITDAAQIITIFERLAGQINAQEAQVDSSTVALLGMTKAGYAKLAFSSLGVDASGDGAIGGNYSAEAGSMMTLVGDAKGGCITLDGIVINLTDGRYGYAIINIPGCEPMIVPPVDTPPETPPGTPPGTPPTTPPNGTTPDKITTGTTPQGGGGSGGTGENGDDPENDDDETGYGPGDSVATMPPTTAAATTTTSNPNVVTGTAPATTNPSAPATTAPGTGTVQTGTTATTVAPDND